MGLFSCCASQNTLDDAYQPQHVPQCAASDREDPIVSAHVSARTAANSQHSKAAPNSKSRSLEQQDLDSAHERPPVQRPTDCKPANTAELESPKTSSWLRRDASCPAQHSRPRSSGADAPQHGHVRQSGDLLMPYRRSGFLAQPSDGEGGVDYVPRFARARSGPCKLVTQTAKPSHFVFGTDAQLSSPDTPPRRSLSAAPVEGSPGRRSLSSRHPLPHLHKNPQVAAQRLSLGSSEHLGARIDNTLACAHDPPSAFLRMATADNAHAKVCGLRSQSASLRTLQEGPALVAGAGPDILPGNKRLKITDGTNWRICGPDRTINTASSSGFNVLDSLGESTMSHSILFNEDEWTGLDRTQSVDAASMRSSMVTLDTVNLVHHLSLTPSSPSTRTPDMRHTGKLPSHGPSTVYEHAGEEEAASASEAASTSFQLDTDSAAASSASCSKESSPREVQVTEQSAPFCPSTTNATNSTPVSRPTSANMPHPAQSPARSLAERYPVIRVDTRLDDQLQYQQTCAVQAGRSNSWAGETVLHPVTAPLPVQQLWPHQLPDIPTDRQAVAMDQADALAVRLKLVQLENECRQLRQQLVVEGGPPEAPGPDCAAGVLKYKTAVLEAKVMALHTSTATTKHLPAQADGAQRSPRSTLLGSLKGRKKGALYNGAHAPADHVRVLP